MCEMCQKNERSPCHRPILYLLLLIVFIFRNFIFESERETKKKNLDDDDDDDDADFISLPQFLAVQQIQNDIYRKNKGIQFQNLVFGWHETTSEDTKEKGFIVYGIYCVALVENFVLYLVLFQLNSKMILRNNAQYV